MSMLCAPECVTGIVALEIRFQSLFVPACSELLFGDSRCKRKAFWAYNFRTVNFASRASMPMDVEPISNSRSGRMLKILCKALYLNSALAFGSQLLFAWPPAVPDPGGPPAALKS